MLKKLNLITSKKVVEKDVIHQVKKDFSQESFEVTIELEINNEKIKVESDSTENALYKLISVLPEGYLIKSCFNCRHGNYCIFGNFDNEIFCMFDIKPKSKEDLVDIFSNHIEYEQRKRDLFHCCSKYQAISKNYWTYNDYIL